MRLIGGGIEIFDYGIKLWRFGKVIPFESIKAISCEPQPFFRRAFFLPDPVYRLVLYKEKNGLTGKPELQAQNIPSFQFDPTEFSSLLGYVSLSCFSICPNALTTLIAQPSSRPVLKRSCETGRVMRVVVSGIIMFSLVSFLGRRAMVNYNFNLANREFRQENYADAEKGYATAAAIDWTFAPAWDRLARSQARQGKVKDAEKHWRKALEVKPDFVESKIGLSQILKSRQEYTEAKKLLKTAIRLSRTNIAAYINLADIELLTGEPEAAKNLLVPIVDKEPTNVRAHALLAVVYLAQGQPSAAQLALGNCNPHRPDVTEIDARYFNAISAQVEQRLKERGEAPRKSP